MSRRVTHLALVALLVTGCPIDGRRLDRPPFAIDGSAGDSEAGEAGEQQTPSGSGSGGRGPASGGSGTADSGQGGEPSSGGEAGEFGMAARAVGGHRGKLERRPRRDGSRNGRARRSERKRRSGHGRRRERHGRRGSRWRGGLGRWWPGWRRQRWCGRRWRAGSSLREASKETASTIAVKRIVANAAFVNNTLEWFAERTSPRFGTQRTLRPIRVQARLRSPSPQPQAARECRWPERSNACRAWTSATTGSADASFVPAGQGEAGQRWTSCSSAKSVAPGRCRHRPRSRSRSRRTRGCPS